MKEKTHFAPPSRSTPVQVLKEKEFIASQKLFAEIFGAISEVSSEREGQFYQ